MRLSNRTFIVIFVLIGLAFIVEWTTNDFSLQRWRKFEWLFLLILVIWLILTKSD